MIIYSAKEEILIDRFIKLLGKSSTLLADTRSDIHLFSDGVQILQVEPKKIYSRKLITSISNIKKRSAEADLVSTIPINYEVIHDTTLQEQAGNLTTCIYAVGNIDYIYLDKKKLFSINAIDHIAEVDCATQTMTRFTTFNDLRLYTLTLDKKGYDNLYLRTCM